MEKVRFPAVSGMFYPGDKDSLNKTIEECFSRAKKHDLGKTIGFIVPHAGYVYSGITAAHAYGSSDFRNRKILLIGPNHRSSPYEVSLYGEGKWKTPLGEIAIDIQGSGQLKDLCPIMVKNESAHRSEHSLEVQVPFLQKVTDNEFTVVPVLLGDQSESTILNLSECIYAVISEYVIIASSDLNHYESLQITREKDERIIRAIVSLDVHSLYETIKETRSTPCGYGAIAFLMDITKRLHGKIELLHHTTSADASGDESEVVGYASLAAIV